VTVARPKRIGQWSGDSGWLARVWRDKACIYNYLRGLVA
jgi:hypothetical protein